MSAIGSQWWIMQWKEASDNWIWIRDLSRWLHGVGRGDVLAGEVGGGRGYGRTPTVHHRRPRNQRSHRRSGHRCLPAIVALLPPAEEHRLFHLPDVPSFHSDCYAVLDLLLDQPRSYQRPRRFRYSLSLRSFWLGLYQLTRSSIDSLHVFDLSRISWVYHYSSLIDLIYIPMIWSMSHIHDEFNSICDKTFRIGRFEFQVDMKAKKKKKKKKKDEGEKTE